MRHQKAKKKMTAIAEIAINDGDKFMYFYGSPADGKYVGGAHNMDIEDAAVVIKRLVEQFGMTEQMLRYIMKAERVARVDH